MISLELAQQVLAEQPFSVLLGARVTEVGAGRAVLELDLRPELLQQNGFAHGGVLAYAADNALTFAGGMVLGPAVLTGGFSIDYLVPAQGALLAAEGYVVRAGRSRATCRCDLYTVDSKGAGTLCAVAQGTVIAVRP